MLSIWSFIMSSGGRAEDPWGHGFESHNGQKIPTLDGVGLDDSHGPFQFYKSIILSLDRDGLHMLKGHKEQV